VSVSLEVYLGRAAGLFRHAPAQRPIEGGNYG
jgi:hypothetical protein